MSHYLCTLNYSFKILLKWCHKMANRFRTMSSYFCIWKLQIWICVHMDLVSWWFKTHHQRYKNGTFSGKPSIKKADEWFPSILTEDVVKRHIHKEKLLKLWAMCKKWNGCDPLVVKNDLTGAQIRLVNLFYLYPTLIDLGTLFLKN